MVTEREIPARQWTRTPSCRSRAPSNRNQIRIKIEGREEKNLPAARAGDLVLYGILIDERKTASEKNIKKLVAMATSS